MHTHAATIHSEHGNNEQCMHIVHALCNNRIVKIVYKMGPSNGITMNYDARALLRAMLII